MGVLLWARFVFLAVVAALVAGYASVCLWTRLDK